jgi:tRNA pseudouridine38-40 synthase
LSFPYTKLISIFVTSKKKQLRYFVKFAYNGTHYHGWQFQPNAASVQETMNKAFSVAKYTFKSYGAGTDTGVHAREMYAHFDIENHLIIQVDYKLNSYLPKIL